MMLQDLRRARPALALLAATALAGCMVGPNYRRPSAPMSTAFKEAPQGWTQAAPADAIERGEWWALFNDPTLNSLEARVRISNQNVAAAEAAYRQARALVAEQRAALFPTIALTPTAVRTGSGGGRAGSGTVVSTGGTSTVIPSGSGATAVNNYRVTLGGTWQPDVWGRIRREIESARATAQASEADLANATLAAQGELAADYFGLREADAEIVLDQKTVEDYRRTQQITQNQFVAGIAPHSDALQAQTQLQNALAALQAAEQTRATYEHAIAMLIGEPAGNFSLPSMPNWNTTTPDVPTGVPSTLLQRRPDIAAAERQMAAANAQIGVAIAAYYPNLTLTGSGGYSSSQISQLFTVPSSLWSVGASAAETIFDGGLRRAEVQYARANYDQTVATYRQTVLAALQNVEDELAASRLLAQQYEARRESSQAADQAAQMVLNQYKAGQVAFTSVVISNAAAYSARIALAQTTGQRQSAAVALIQALGGGYHQPQGGGE